MIEVPLYMYTLVRSRGVTQLIWHPRNPCRAMFFLRASIMTCRGTPLIRNRNPVGPYSRTMPRLLWRS